MEQDRRHRAGFGRHAAGPRRTEHDHAGVQDGPTDPHRRLRRHYGANRRPRPRMGRPLGQSARRSASGAGCGASWSWGLRASSRCRPAPRRLAGFTELAATAIASAQARVELRGLRRGAGGAAPGGDAGRPRGAAGGGVRRGHRGGRAAAARSPRVRWPGTSPTARSTVVAAWTSAAPPAHLCRHPDEPRRAERDHAGVPDGPSRPASTTTLTPQARPATSSASSGLRCGGRRAGQRRGPAVGPDGRGVHARAAAAGRHRGAAGRVHRAGRHRDRQRAGALGAARLRRGAGGAAPGGDAGGPGRRRRRRCSPRSPRRPGGCWAPTHAA